MKGENRSLLIVDDEPRIVSSIERILRKENYTLFTCNSGKEGLEVVRQHQIGVVMSDLMMPEMDGVTFLENVRYYDKDIVQLLLTGNATLDNALSAINRLQIFGYMTKPWPVDGLRSTIANAFAHYNLIRENKNLLRITEKQNLELQAINENLETLVKQRTLLLEEAVYEGITMLSTAAEAKDDDTGEHVFRVLDMCFELALAIGLSQTQAEKISRFSPMHDIGKIHIPDQILQKPGPLSPKEWELMKQHTVFGEKILGVKPFYKMAREIARSHHENWDGSGYPDGLKGEDIPLPARIVSIVDVFDALTNKRPYKDAWSFEKTISVMESLTGKFDPEILPVFIQMQKDKHERLVQKKKQSR